jgi:SPX domain protein involved in polyphosphate accumulation
MELRYEYKYYVPQYKEADLRKLLSPFVNYDKYALGRSNFEYTVRSIYFDTPDFQFYHDKLEGLSYRKKVRIRGYNLINCSNPVFLEIKNKYQIPLHKTRAKACYEEIKESFESGDLQTILKDITKDSSEANSFLYQILSKNLKPVVLVIYEREAFEEKISTSNRLRITFDKNLRSTKFPKINELYCENDIKKSLPGYFILEVKFNKFYPAWLKSIVAAFQLKLESASKYVISMDAHQIVSKYNRYQVLEKKII